MSTYTGAHERVAAMFGRATGYMCHLCIDIEARDWALHPNAEDAYPVVVNAKGDTRLISDNPFSYFPLCRSCHCRLDRGYASWAELETEGKKYQRPVDLEREARWIAEFPDLLRRLGRGDDASRLEEFLEKRRHAGVA